jgi:HEAT repeat protein
VSQGPVARAAELAELGHQGPLAPDSAARVERALGDDPDPRVRASALGALVRAGRPDDAVGGWRASLLDPAAAVRRRAAELAPLVVTDTARVGELMPLLHDRDVTVVEAAAWALGELGRLSIDAGAVAALAGVVETHHDALAREAAVAALGALGDPAGLPAVLAACSDRVAVRRRAVLALAPFDGPDVDAALAAALDDKDWQVRQAAEDLRS